jgi:hypothetical protein
MNAVLLHALPDVTAPGSGDAFTATGAGGGDGSTHAPAEPNPEALPCEYPLKKEGGEHEGALLMAVSVDAVHGADVYCPVPGVEQLLHVLALFSPDWPALHVPEAHATHVVLALGRYVPAAHGR